MMLTIVETPLFQSLWPDYWDEDERDQRMLKQIKQEIENGDD